MPEFGRDNVVNSVYMGDYNHAVATANEFHVVWSDNRDDLPGGAPRKDPNVYYEKIILGPPCPVGVASNPNPASGSTNVSINLPQITWANGAGATSIEVFFNGSSVYTGAPITSYSVPGPLNYSTTYSWRVDESNSTCTTYGPNWTFTTIPDPNLIIDTIDVYPQDLNYWTGTCDASTKTEVSLVDANGADFAGWMAFDISSIPNNATIVSITFNGYLYNNNWPYWAITPMGIVNPITGTAAEIYNQASSNYAEGIAYSYNAGTRNNDKWLAAAPLGNYSKSRYGKCIRSRLVCNWYL